MKKIAIACKAPVKRFGVEKGLELCKKYGFDAVDFGVAAYHGSSVYNGSDDEFESFFTEIKKKADALELEIAQTHGFCATYVPEDEEYNRSVDELTAKDLRATSLLGAPSCVVHFINSTRWDKQSPALMHEVCGKMYDAFVPAAEKYKVNIAMETFGAARIKGARIRDFFADPTEFKRQYDRLDTKYKTICVDTGHTHEAESFWVPPPEEMIRILGKDVTLLHLHDNSGHWDDHLLPGMGNINWPAVFDALDDIGYSGVYNFEIGYSFAGKLMEDYLLFLGKYLRAFVDNHGSLK
jgi:sugar phosphate isomerase/epimerase